MAADFCAEVMQQLRLALGDIVRWMDEDQFNEWVAEAQASRGPAPEPRHIGFKIAPQGVRSFEYVPPLPRRDGAGLPEQQTVRGWGDPGEPPPSLPWWWIFEHHDPGGCLECSHGVEYRQGAR